jgi:class 3 adenylate cyclase
LGRAPPSAIWRIDEWARLPWTVTFLFSDNEGSTHLFEEYQASMRAAVARHDELPHSVIAEYGGFVFGTRGDGVAAALLDDVGDHEASLMFGVWVNREAVAAGYDADHAPEGAWATTIRTRPSRRGL